MIYFAQTGEGGPVKIGHTKRDVRLRIIAIQVGSPYRVKLLRQIEGGQQTERWLHRHFATRAISGEWFHYSPEMLTVQPPIFESVKQAKKTFRVDGRRPVECPGDVLIENGRAYWNNALLPIPHRQVRMLGLLLERRNTDVSYLDLFAALSDGLSAALPKATFAVQHAMNNVRREFVNLTPHFDRIRTYTAFGYRWQDPEAPSVARDNQSRAA